MSQAWASPGVDALRAVECGYDLRDVVHQRDDECAYKILLTPERA
jgi:hypothetical protein